MVGRGAMKIDRNTLIGGQRAIFWPMPVIPMVSTSSLPTTIC
jgi:hypothetical protein